MLIIMNVNSNCILVMNKSRKDSQLTTLMTMYRTDLQV